MKYINQIEPLITDREVKAMTEYLQSGGWLTEFKKTEEFEQMIAGFLGVKYCVVVTSGTVALYLSLLALGIGPGDSVIVPDYTMIATPNAVKWTGADVILCDISQDNLCLDLDKIERIEVSTQAMIYVPINGRCGDMNKINEFCDKNKIHLIEDACQAFGSKWNDKFLGTFGRIGVFSFTPHKIITTGQGGAIVTNHKDVYEEVKKLKDFYRLRPGVDVHRGIGYNFKFTDLQAVVGIEQLRDIDYRIKRKKAIYRAYNERLCKVDFIEMLPTDLFQTVPWFVDILLKDCYREDFIAHLASNGIGSRPFYPPIHFQAPYSDCSSFKPAQKDWSEFTYMVYKGVWLPSSFGLSLEQIDYICDVIKKFPRREIHERK